MMFTVIEYKNWYFIRNTQTAALIRDGRGRPYGYSTYMEASAVCGHHNRPFER